MKTIIAGSRTITDYKLLCEAIRKSGFDITEVVSGVARGVDALGERYAADNGIPTRRFPANWNEHGRAAGPIRNGEMAKYADALTALWDGQSRGTRDMLHKAYSHGLAIYLARTDDGDDWTHEGNHKQ